MPPVRTKSDTIAPEMEYSVPPRGITFAPNIDAETYGAPPPLIAPPPSTLFPAPDDDPSPSPSPRRASHARKKPDDWIPRPPNAFILFRSEMVEQFIKSQHVPGDVEANHGNLSKIIGLCWRNLPFPERSVWEHKARLAQAAHKAQYPHYRFRPHTKAAATAPAPPRRRVKEPPAPPDARRVAHIAGLLVGGVKGARLARAVRALDEERAPTEMRFDEPVTAAQFGGARKRRGRVARAEAASAETVSEECAETVSEECASPALPEQAPTPPVDDPFDLACAPFPFAAWPPASDDALPWSPAPDAAWSPAEDAGTWSPADDAGTWSPADDARWSPAEDTGTWSPADDPAAWPHAAPAPYAFSPFPPELTTATTPADSPQRSPTLAPYDPALFAPRACAALDLFAPAPYGLHEYDEYGRCFEF